MNVHERRATLFLLLLLGPVVAYVVYEEKQESKAWLEKTNREAEKKHGLPPGSLSEEE